MRRLFVPARQTNEEGDEQCAETAECPGAAEHGVGSKGDVTGMWVLRGRLECAEEDPRTYTLMGQLIAADAPRALVLGAHVDGTTFSIRGRETGTLWLIAHCESGKDIPIGSPAGYVMAPGSDLDVGGLRVGMGVVWARFVDRKAKGVAQLRVIVSAEGIRRECVSDRDGEIWCDNWPTDTAVVSVVGDTRTMPVEQAVGCSEHATSPAVITVSARPCVKIRGILESGDVLGGGVSVRYWSAAARGPVQHDRSDSGEFFLPVGRWELECDFGPAVVAHDGPAVVNSVCDETEVLDIRCRLSAGTGLIKGYVSESVSVKRFVVCAWQADASGVPVSPITVSVVSQGAEAIVAVPCGKYEIAAAAVSANGVWLTPPRTRCVVVAGVRNAAEVPLQCAGAVSVEMCRRADAGEAEVVQIVETTTEPVLALHIPMPTNTLECSAEARFVKESRLTEPGTHSWWLVPGHYRMYIRSSSGTVDMPCDVVATMITPLDRSAR